MQLAHESNAMAACVCVFCMVAVVAAVANVVVVCVVFYYCCFFFFSAHQSYTHACNFNCYLGALVEKS